MYELVNNATIGLDNGFSPVRPHAITRNKACDENFVCMTTSPFVCVFACVTSVTEDIICIHKTVLRSLIAPFIHIFIHIFVR